MKIVNSIILSVLGALCIVSCGKDIETLPSGPRMVEAGFSMPVVADNRTTIAEDGKTTYWEAGDKVVLWAKNSAGEYTVENTTFFLRHFSSDYTRAFFTATIPEMEEGSYEYMFCSPVPSSVAGTQVTYNIPATQDGTYQGKHDVMVATPVEGEALDGMAVNNFEVNMHHLMHALRIDIPEGKNKFGYRFTKLEITFPTPVVGDVTFDVTEDNPKLTYTNLSNTIVIENDNGFDAGDTIWAFVLPGTVSGEVSYRVRGERRRSVVDAYSLQRSMQSGHVTPITMATPELDLYTVFYFSIDENLLGEEFNTFTIYDHYGSALGTFTRNEENIYPLEYFGEIDLSAYQNVDLTLSFDSDHAIVSNVVNTGTLTPYCEHTMTPVDVPYLFEEDFSTVSSFSDGHDDPANGFSGDSWNYKSWFSDHTSDARMAGWSGGRYGCQGGASLRILCRSEAAGFIAKYRGRVDTPALSKIKSGVTTGLRVQFDYSAAMRNYWITSGSTVLNFGWTNTTGVIAPDTDISNLVIDSETVSDTSGSYTTVTNHKEVTFTGASNATRLSWISSCDASGGATVGNANNWLYIDNIKVQIAN